MKTVKIKVYTIREMVKRAKAEEEQIKKAPIVAGEALTKKPAQKALQNILERHRYWNVEGLDWWESEYERFAALLTILGFDVEASKDFQFSGFGSQGDGASFTCSSLCLPRLYAAFCGDDPIKAITEHARESKDTATQKCLSENGWFAESELRRLIDEAAYGARPVGPKGVNWGAWGDSGARLWSVRGDIKRGTTHYVHAHTCTLTLDVDGELQEEADAQLLLRQVQELEGDLDQVRRNLCGMLYRDLEELHNSSTTDEAVIASLEANDMEFMADGREWR